MSLLHVESNIPHPGSVPQSSQFHTFFPSLASALLSVCGMPHPSSQACSLPLTSLSLHTLLTSPSLFSHQYQYQNSQLFYLDSLFISLFRGHPGPDTMPSTREKQQHSLTPRNTTMATSSTGPPWLLLRFRSDHATCRNHITKQGGRVPEGVGRKDSSRPKKRLGSAGGNSLASAWRLPT